MLDLSDCHHYIPRHGDPERESAMAQLLFVLNVAAIPLFTGSMAVFLGLTDPVNRAVF